MKIPTLFKEYIWLIETINRVGKITLAELSEQWQEKEESEGMPLSRTTFNRHRDAILEMFGVIRGARFRDAPPHAMLAIIKKQYGDLLWILN